VATVLLLETKFRLRMQAIKELADRLDGKPTQILEHTESNNLPVKKIVCEIVHVSKTREELERGGERFRPLHLEDIRHENEELIGKMVLNGLCCIHFFRVTKR
jgi:hypothetical protein